MGSGRLEGKVAVVTGASQGIGRAIVLEFAREGARVVAGARNIRNLAETSRLCAEPIISQACDVRVEDDVRALVQKAVDHFGGLHVMCNNAGVLPESPLVDTTAEMWDEVMEINVRGTFFGCKYAIPAMVGTGSGGSIINMGSTCSFSAEHGSGAYVASKGAVLMLTKNAAAECAEHGIRVNAICPGATETAMAITDTFLASVGGREKATNLLARYQPLTGLIPVDDIPPIAVFLASDDSRSMTGTSILADGGLLASWDHIVS